jgi:hypothetical protein
MGVPMYEWYIAFCIILIIVILGCCVLCCFSSMTKKPNK